MSQEQSIYDSRRDTSDPKGYIGHVSMLRAYVDVGPSNSSGSAKPYFKQVVTASWTTCFYNRAGKRLILGEGASGCCVFYPSASKGEQEKSNAKKVEQNCNSVAAVATCMCERVALILLRRLAVAEHQASTKVRFADMLIDNAFVDLRIVFRCSSFFQWVRYRDLGRDLKL